jgi:quinol monooxygenase YgiN
MSFNITAIVTPTPGKESRVEELIKDLTAKVEKNEANVERYMCYKTKNAEGVVEFVFHERYVNPSFKPSENTRPPMTAGT